jgi:collagen type III alpha/collagen type V/XI/XXIV/XXVII alpha
MSIAELEAAAAARADAEAREAAPVAVEPPSADDVAGALGLGFLGISTDGDDFSLPPRVPRASEDSAAAKKSGAGSTSKGDDGFSDAGAGKKSRLIDEGGADALAALEAEARAKSAAKAKAAREAKEAEARAKAEAREAALAKTRRYGADELRAMNVACDAKPPEVDADMFDAADREKAAREEAEAKARAKAEAKAAAEKAKAEKAEKAKAEKEAREAKRRAEKEEKEARARGEDALAKSRSTDRLDDDEPSLGGALGLGFLGISTGASDAEVTNPGAKTSEEAEEKPKAKAKPEAKPEPAAGDTAEEKAETRGMSNAALAAALLAELRGLEDRVEVAGDEEGAMMSIKLGAALEAIRQEPFKSI